MRTLKQMLALILVGLFIGLAILIVYSGNGYLDMKRFQVDLVSLETENAALQKENERLSREIRRLKQDDAYLEYVARQELGMVRPDDVILQFHATPETTVK